MVGEKRQALFAKAAQALRTARANLRQGDPDAAANRAYYAAFYAATAALLSVDERPRTHQGVHRRFFVNFVEAGPLNVQTGSILAFAQDVRRRADYDAFTTLDVGATTDLVSDVERFVQAVREMLST